MGKTVQVFFAVSTTLLLLRVLVCMILLRKSGVTLDHHISSQEKLPREICTILFVGTIRGPTFTWTMQNKDFLTSCSHEKRCLVTKKRQKLADADVVIVNGHVQEEIILKLLSEKSDGHQLFVYYTVEGPLIRPSLKIYNHQFDLTASYQSNSDVVVPYGRYLPLSVGDPRPPTDFNYFEGKTRMVYWAVSHCDNFTRQRMETAYLLEKYGVTIHVSGGCGGYFPHRDDLIKIPERFPQTEETVSWREAGKVYKFYFAAENAFSEEYITEKYWRNALEGNMIPIVQGGADYSKLAIPGSYIRVTDFDTIADLAKYILKVANDKDLYNSYFRWKQKFKKDTIMFDMEKSLLCPLCSIAHNASYYSRSPVDLFQFSPSVTRYTSKIIDKHRAMVLEATNMTGVEIDFNTLSIRS